MTDSIVMPKAPKTPSNAAPVNAGYLGVDLGEFQLGTEECKKINGNGSLVKGLEFLLFPQCNNGAEANKPILSIPCDYQTKDGITWELKHETGEIATNCPNETRLFTKKENMTLEVSLSAIALADGSLMDFLQGRVVGANGNIRATGFGAIRNYTAVLIDRESMTMAIYPNVQYKPDTVSVKYSYDNEPNSKIMFMVSKADLGDGQPSFFYEVRSIAPKAA